MKALMMGIMQVLPCCRAPSAPGVHFKLPKLWPTMLQGHLKTQATLPQKGPPLGQVRFLLTDLHQALSPHLVNGCCMAACCSHGAD